MASTLFTRCFLAASHRMITPSLSSLLPQKTLNPAALLSKRAFYSQIGSVSRAYNSTSWARRPMASTGFGPRAGYLTSSASTNEPFVSVDWLHDNLKEPDLKVLDASWYMPEEQRNPIQEYQNPVFTNMDTLHEQLKADLIEHVWHKPRPNVN